MFNLYRDIHMKKTLVALAVLAASGASFAQATITGTYAFGYASTTGGGVAASSGLGTDTADINFAASENLGGGMTASAKMGISGAQRGGAVTGNSASVGIKSASFGLTLGTVESANGLLAIGSSGAAGYGMDGKAISGSANIDLLSLSIPMSSALTMGATYVDRGVAGVGLGLGTVGTADAQPSVGISLTYAAGALAAKGDYTSWTRLNDALVASALNKSRIRLSAGYDMGMARLSAGYSNTTRDSVANGTVTETLLGVKVPMGAVTLGLDYAMGTASGNDDTSGYSLGVGYDLSKRTNVGASVANWKQRTGLVAATESQQAFRVLVAHSF
jgi:membrane-bound inhibitor of C-type lysozyme